MDLTTLSLPDLHSLNTQVAQEMKTREAANMARARDQIVQIAKDAGISLKDLLRPILSGSKKKVAAKFRNPSNPAEEWTGRGRTPKWARDLQEAGQLERARIK